MRILMACLVLVWSSTMFASPIFYTATDLADDTAGNDLWRYDYEIANTTGFNIGFFDILFNTADYDFRLVNVPGVGLEVDTNDYQAATGWDAIAFPEDETFGFDGVYNVAQSSGPFGFTAAADAIIGFSITFIWRGIGDPGSQFFEYFDALTFGSLGSGFTQLRNNPPVGVPEPSTGILLGLGLIAIALRRRLTSQTIR